MFEYIHEKKTRTVSVLELVFERCSVPNHPYSSFPFVKKNDKYIPRNVDYIPERRKPDVIWTLWILGKLCYD